MSIFLDDNLEQREDGTVVCRHCSTLLGTATNPLSNARLVISRPSEAGPAVRADPSNFAAREIVLRRTLCPQCLTMLRAEIVPADEPTFRTSRVGTPA